MRFRFAFGMLGTLAALVVPRPLTMPKSVLSSADDIEGRRLHHASARGGGCKANIFIFARGTGEFGDMGSVVGPPVCNALKKALGDHAVACEGVKYSAGVTGNMIPGGDPVGVNGMKNQAAKAVKNCPQSNILLGGYSQGGGVAHHAIEHMSASTKKHVAGVVLFGDPSLLMGGGKIPGFPSQKVKEFCAGGDPVCGHPTGNTGGGLSSAMGHLSYGSSAPQAAKFLAQRVHAQAASDRGAGGANGGGGGGKGSGGGGGGGDTAPSSGAGGGGGDTAPSSGASGSGDDSATPKSDGDGKGASAGGGSDCSAIPKSDGNGKSAGAGGSDGRYATTKPDGNGEDDGVGGSGGGSATPKPDGDGKGAGAGGAAEPDSTNAGAGGAAAAGGGGGAAAAAAVPNGAGGDAVTGTDSAAVGDADTAKPDNTSGGGGGGGTDASGAGGGSGGGSGGGGGNSI